MFYICEVNQTLAAILRNIAKTTYIKKNEQMEILYIWLQEYKNFKEQGFNFSSEYIFDVKKKGKNKYALNIKKNNGYIPNFFERQNISNITAIIGQNGSGKSNILEFIKTSLPEGYAEIQAQGIISYRIGHNYIVLIPNNSFEVEISQTDNLFEVHKYPFNLVKEAGLYGTNYSDAEYIFYSNTFDLKLEEYNMRGLHNISTLALLRADTERENGNPFIRTGGEYDNYRANEIRRNIQFILSDHTDLLNNFPLPEALYIEILESDLKRYFTKDKNQDVQKILKHFNEELNSTNRTSDVAFLNNLYIAVFLNFITAYREYSSIKNLIDNITLNNDKTIKDFVKNFFTNIPNIKHEGHNIIDFSNKSLIANQFFNYVEDLLDKKSFSVEALSRKPNYTIKFEIKQNALEELTKFLSLYIQLKGLTEFLNFNWRNLSSGEQSFFSLISRFYHLKHHQIQHEDLKKNMVIMIDEGDIYFHPDWQKKFFKLVIDYLSKLFQDHNLQIIFTANTPFLTSDLPKSNIIFIEKMPDNSIVVHGLENNRKETFGGNIHTLFADSFYMKGALIGDFSKDKINNIIDYLKNKDSQNKDYYKKVIDIIGEPILKRKLQEMWYEKFGIDEEIETLKKRIEELKNKKTNKSNKK